jgi:methionyl-tRNA formyltransferase
VVSGNFQGMKKSIALFTDSQGLGVLQKVEALEDVTIIVGSDSRPQHFTALQSAANYYGVEFLAQPGQTEASYKSFIRRFQSASPDVILCCSYSRLIPLEVLQSARFGGVNIHYALLPRNRGKHPVQWAIMNGERATGVTLHEMSSEIDQGPIIDQGSTPIYLDDTWQTVTSRLDSLAVGIIGRNLVSLVEGSWAGAPQDETRSTLGRARSRVDSEIDWSWPAIRIHDHIRALVPPLPPAFYRDHLGNPCEIGAYLPMHKVWELKHEFGSGGGAEFPWGRLIPNPSRTLAEGATDVWVSFDIVSSTGRLLGGFDVWGYHHEEACANVCLSFASNKAAKSDLGWLKDFVLSWITTEFGLKRLVERG